MRVLVTGASGQLGYDVIRELTRQSIECCGVSSKDVDITDAAAVDRLFAGYMPTAVVHCAAYTAVDKAEIEREQCAKVNVDGTRNIAAGCLRYASKLIYISTDYVFAGIGDGYYEATAATSPINWYGQTKLAGEQAVQEIMKNYFIVRISWVFGKNGSNFVKTMLRLGQTYASVNVVGDQIGSPTYTVDLAKLLVELMNTDKYGIYQATNEGVCSWAEFAAAIFAAAELPVRVNAITTAEYPTPARRPHNSRLSKGSLTAAGFRHLPAWQDALRRYLAEIKE